MEQNTIKRTTISINALELPSGVLKSFDSLFVRAEDPRGREGAIHDLIVDAVAKAMGKDKFIKHTKWFIPKSTFILAPLPTSELEKLTKWLKANDDIYVCNGGDGCALILNVSLASKKWSEKRVKASKNADPTQAEERECRQKP